MARTLVVGVVAAVLVGAFVLALSYLKRPEEPPVNGYLEGQEIKFIHTEVSDPKIARILTDMISSPVLTVPALARAPETLLAHVYVFANGVKDGGPLKFQRDVFDSPPGTPGYSPLRRIMLVTWNSSAHPRVLRSLAEVKAAEAKGELTIKDSRAVINIPLLTWPGGHR
jgi:hypothetical protein